VVAPSGPDVVVVVVTWQGAHLLGACLRSLRGQSRAHDVLVVDNASSDGTTELLARDHPDVDVLRLPTNTGFAGGVQAALEHLDHPWVALLNNDAVAHPGWLDALVAEAEAHPGAAAITSCIRLQGTEPQVLNNTGVVLTDTWYGADRGLGAPLDAFPDPGDVFGFSGGAALLRADAVRAVGGFPAPFFLYYEDTDTSWRLRSAGWTVRYAPSAVVDHLHSATSDQRSASFAFHNERNRLLMLVRCAPLGVVVRCWARFVLTTTSLAVRGGRRGPHNFRPALRLRVLWSAARLLPWAVRTRRTTG
jgi:GT2 family glycosyltransferase